MSVPFNLSAEAAAIFDAATSREACNRARIYSAQARNTPTGETTVSHEHCLVTRPGDTLIITVPHNISEEQYDRLRRCAEKDLPGLKVVVIENVGSATIYRPDSDDEDGVQCRHIEPGTPCDWNVCRQPERLAAGDRGDDPARQQGAAVSRCEEHDVNEPRLPHPGETWYRISDPEDIAMIYEVHGESPTVYWTSPANPSRGRPVAKTWATRMDDFAHDFAPQPAVK